MAFITGVLLIDAPASALNMGQGEETKALVKAIRAGVHEYPYASAQAFRFWLRQTLETYYPEWQASPIYTAVEGKKQQAYTEGNPMTYWDDDLLGYMRAQKEAEGGTLTRVSPFRTSTLVSIAPVEITEDFGVMARHEGNPLLHGHEFYRATLKGLFSLDLRAAGTFNYVRRTGHLNLGPTLAQQAEAAGLTHLHAQKAYRLPFAQRLARVQTLLYALARLEGGARQTLHYTDVSPAFVMVAVTRGGNHPFGRVITEKNGEPIIHEEVLNQLSAALQDELVSGVFVGHAPGFMDSADEVLAQYGLNVLHPREALDSLAAEIGQHPEWWE